MNREEIRQSEMNPDTNPLIPGGKAAKEAEREELENDKTPQGEMRRDMHEDFNALIPNERNLEFARKLMNK